MIAESAPDPRAGAVVPGPADDAFWSAVAGLAVAGGGDLALLEAAGPYAHRWLVVPASGDVTAVRAQLAPDARVTVFPRPPAPGFVPPQGEGPFHGFLDGAYRSVSVPRLPGFLAQAGNAARWGLYAADDPGALHGTAPAAPARATAPRTPAWQASARTEDPELTRAKQERAQTWLLVAAAVAAVAQAVELVLAALRRHPGDLKPLIVALSPVAGFLFWAEVALFVVWCVNTGKVLLAAGRPYSVARHWSSRAWYVSCGLSLAIGLTRTFLPGQWYVLGVVVPGAQVLGSVVLFAGVLSLRSFVWHRVTAPAGRPF
jgi:hypothetical protein